jgi:hypothetical protein
MRPERAASFRIAGAVAMAFLSLWTAILLLIMPKSGGDAAVWLAFGQVLAGAVIARAIVFLRGDYFGVTVIPRPSRFPYIVVGVFILIASALISAGAIGATVGTVAPSWPGRESWSLR